MHTITKVFANDFFCSSTAVFSLGYTHRYLLRRTWEAERGFLHWLMLNPSDADEANNDPTLERCQQRSFDMGFGGFIVTNLFGFRSPYPDQLHKAADPIGDENDRFILKAAEECAHTVCGWGTNGGYMGRDKAVLAMLRKASAPLYVLAINQDGSPGHPLYLPYDLEPTRWAA